MLDRLAIELNETLDSSVAGSFLSSFGRRIFFPKGIVAQSAEAGAKAKRHNATVGLAKSKGQPMYLTDIYSYFKEDLLQPSDIFSYAPGGGDKELRSAWKEEMIKKNPTLKGKLISLPIVTGGLTHTISTVANLFFDEGDEIVCPDLFWDNYELIFVHAKNGSLKFFNFYDENNHFNVEGMKQALLDCKGETARIILNFPNNPTGYTPSKDEMLKIKNAIVEVAETGKKVLVLSDDAYYGLFFEEETEKESLFAFLADAHENIFAIKGDAATKEEMVWGFRVGFITYASKSFNDKHLDALNSKSLGAIRCSVSNCDRPGQTLILKALKEGKHYNEDKEKTFKEMEARYKIVKKELENYRDSKLLKPYPFNSGYFMAFDTMGRSAEELRTYLLEKYSVGAINIMDRTLRLAYCSVEQENIKELLSLVYTAAGEIWT
ncbi:MAG: aminotransferase class I/II-fold pyridoxal phosphate-dependent enzyme [Sphaerochaetaceae bacterium]|nr:aminotransferase class I/II-fold pyridoxal phosphate-dependent enzyme [Sphaerochaetaceae bacterium]